MRMAAATAAVRPNPAGRVPLSPIAMIPLVLHASGIRHAFA